MDLKKWQDHWESEPVTLSTPLTQSSSFRFPLQSQQARQEVLWGAALLFLLPGIGWLLNMGHRIEMVHRMHHHQSPWPGWGNYPRLLKNGGVTFLGMLYYYCPSFAAWYFDQQVLACLLWVMATIAIPGYMTHYCKHFDQREIFNPIIALSRVAQGGTAYWKAWAIVLKALAISFLGLPFGIGFLVTSVWFWQVAGFSFATVFTTRYQLGEGN